MIYLDHNATTPLHPAVLEAMLPYLGERFGNPSSAHRLGSEARCAVEDAREQVAVLLGAEPREIVFTSGGTEANNLALSNAAGHLVTSAVEHASVLEPAAARTQCGVALTRVGVDAEGRVRASEIAAALRPDTGLVSIGWANNEIGTIQPMAEIAGVCRQRGITLHSDAVQALGKIPIDASAVDLLSISAHKIGGPKGVGALFVRRGVALRPLLRGGSQERERRAGTENVAAIVGFGIACERAVERLRHGREIQRLRDALWEGLSTLPGVRRNSPARECLPNTLNVSVCDRSGDALVAAFDLAGIAVSTGSACAAGASEPSHVLRALGVGERLARDAIRFSLGPDTTGAEIETVVAVLARLLAAKPPPAIAAGDTAPEVGR